MVGIKEEILKKLKKVESAPFLFVGSGVSRRYLNLENWEELLRKFSEEATGNPFQYELYQNEITEEKEYGRLPQVAKLLEKDFIKTFLTDEKFKAIREENTDKIKRGISSFKIALGNHFKNIKFEESDKEIKLLRKIAQRNVAGIITTNYDEFIEKIFQGYTTYVGQEELIFSTIYETGEIYKIHGCCTKPESIVITEKDYEDFIRKSDYLTAKLLTIFLEHPIIFIGYSISDKNIRNILKSISNCLPQDKLNILKERFIFIEWCNAGKEDISSYTITFENRSTIEMTKISLNDFSVLYEGLLENKIKYNPKVLRRLKEDVYELVKNNDTQSKISVVDIENVDNYDDLEIVVGVGVYKDLGTQGYSRIKAENLYEDIIWSKNNYNAQKIVENTLPELLRSNSGGLPIFKYLEEYKGDLPDKIKEQIDKIASIGSFLGKTERNGMENRRKKIVLKSIAGLLNQFGESEAYKYILYLNEKEIKLSEMEDYLKKIITGTEILQNNSILKKVIRVYDWIKYRKSP